MRRYQVALHDFFRTLVHIDAYRIESLDEMDVIGLKDLLYEPTSIICIEWADRIADALPKDAVHITFTHNAVLPNGASRTAVYG